MVQQDSSLQFAVEYLVIYFFVYQVESASKTPPYQNSKECDDANCSVIC